MGKPSSKSEESKSDRKFQKKVEFYNKIRNTVASLTVQKTIEKKKKLRSRQKKLKAYDLSSLTESLPPLNNKNPRVVSRAEFKANCKSRQKLVLKENKQLSEVLKDTAFQSDPLACIYQHLQRTQPVLDEKVKPKKKNKNGGKRKKNKKSKASEGPESMVM
ncbi:hypothetical protein UlMin_032180 [Ulmus minor]